MGRKANDLAGRVFGRLTVVGRAKAPPGYKDAFWRCLCQCGGKHVVVGRSLLNGSTKSCGCLNREFARRHRKVERNAELVRRIEAGESRVALAKEYGITRPRVYQIWLGHKRAMAKRKKGGRRVEAT